MKKLATLICLSAMAVGAHGQGQITGNSFFAGHTALVSTNGSSVGQGTGLVSHSLNGPTTSLYEFAVLTGSSSISGSQNNPFNGLWTFTGVYGTNNVLITQSGGMTANGAATGWAAGASNAFMIAVWSTSIGFDWATVSAEISNNVFTVTGSNSYGWLGFSDVGWLISGGLGFPPTPATPIFGTPNPDGQPINTHTILLPVSAVHVSAVPEPTTFALLGLGAAGLLIFRRRKE